MMVLTVPCEHDGAQCPRSRRWGYFGRVEILIPDAGSRGSVRTLWCCARWFCSSWRCRRPCRRVTGPGHRRQTFWWRGDGPNRRSQSIPVEMGPWSSRPTATMPSRWAGHFQLERMPAMTADDRFRGCRRRPCGRIRPAPIPASRSTGTVQCFTPIWGRRRHTAREADRPW